jgi:hypothetical protein
MPVLQQTPPPRLLAVLMRNQEPPFHPSTQRTSCGTHGEWRGWRWCKAGKLYSLRPILLFATKEAYCQVKYKDCITWFETIDLVVDSDAGFPFFSMSFMLWRQRLSLSLSWLKARTTAQVIGVVVLTAAEVRQGCSVALNQYSFHVISLVRLLI